MRESARKYNLEKPPIINPKILAEVEKDRLIPSLENVKVYVLGVHSCGRTEVYYNTLRDFWLQYFEKAGAQVVCYSMDRRWKNE